MKQVYLNGTHKKKENNNNKYELYEKFENETTWLQHNINVIQNLIYESNIIMGLIMMQIIKLEILPGIFITHEKFLHNNSSKFGY